MTIKIMLQAVRQFYFTTYSKKDKYKSRYPIKKKSSRYKER